MDIFNDVDDFVSKNPIHNGNFTDVIECEKDSSKSKKYIMKIFNFTVSKPKTQKIILDIFYQIYKKENQYIRCYKYISFKNNFKPAFTMDYISSKTLQNLLNDPYMLKSLDIQYIMNCIFTVSEAMKYLHEKLITHSNLCPANIIIDDKNQFYVIDFGLYSIKKLYIEKKYLFASDYRDPQLGNHEPDFKNDIYSFGILICQLFLSYLQKDNKYQKETLHAFIKNQNKEKYINFPKFCIDLIPACLNLNKKERPSFKQIIENFENKKYDHDDIVISDLYKKFKDETSTKKRGRPKKTANKDSITIDKTKSKIQVECSSDEDKSCLKSTEIEEIDSFSNNDNFIEDHINKSHNAHNSITSEQTTNTKKRGRPKKTANKDSITIDKTKSKIQVECSSDEDKSCLDSTEIEEIDSFSDSDNFIEDHINKSHNAHNSITSEQTTNTKKRGRPKKTANKDSITIDKTKNKKKVNNNINIQKLDNPHLHSLNTQPTFSIILPHKYLTKNLPISLYESKNEKENWEKIEYEQIFCGGNAYTEMNFNNKIETEVITEKQTINIEEENISLNDLKEKLQPFPDCFIAQSYISKANKGYVLIKNKTEDPNLLSFKCRAKGCFYRIDLIKEQNGFIIQHQTHHTCTKKAIISTSKIDEIVHATGWREHLDKKYISLITNNLGLLPGEIDPQRIRRSFGRVFNLSRTQRLCSWGMLESFVQIIKKSGGYGNIHKNKDGYIDFIGIVPNYAIRFMSSSIFFPVTQLDSRFQTCIACGRLYGLVTLTGNRSLLPLAFGWASSEKGEFTDMLFDMIPKEIHFIKCCHTDEALALINSVEKVGIENLLCTWHMSHHCPDKQAFISLVKSKTPQEYEIKKQNILKLNGNLANYLNKNSRWKKISRFESDLPRDLCIASTTAESLNALIVKLHLKNKEPLEVLMNIYDIGYFCIKNICLQKGTLTESADDWLDYAMTVAHHLTIVQSPLYLWKFEVYKEGDASTKCTVIIIPSEKPTCKCRFYEDCGMPCVHMLAVAIKFEMNWGEWIHPRYFISNYKLHFQNTIEYPDFDRVIQTNNDKPEKVSSLKQRNKRIPTPGEAPPSHKK